jgi:hypothetical protein
MPFLHEARPGRTALGRPVKDRPDAQDLEASKDLSIASRIIHRQESSANLAYSALAKQLMRRIGRQRAGFSQSLHKTSISGILAPDSPGLPGNPNQLNFVANRC